MLYERDVQACWSKSLVLLVYGDPSGNPQTSLGGRRVCNSVDVQAMCLLVHQVQCQGPKNEGYLHHQVHVQGNRDCFLRQTRTNEEGVHQHYWCCYEFESPHDAVLVDKCVLSHIRLLEVPTRASPLSLASW